MSRDNEVDLLARRGEGVDMTQVLHEALSLDRNVRRRRQAEKFGRVLGDRVRPATGEADSDPAVEKARQEAIEARRLADEARARLARRA